MKRDQTVADPFRLLRATLLTTLADGSLRSSDSDAQRLIRQLDLNSPRLRAWRVMWMRIVDLARDRDAGLYSQLVGFPADLPNLRKLRPPRNDRMEGIEESWFARRQRGVLPTAY